MPDNLKKAIRREIACEKIANVFSRLRKPMEKYQQEYMTYKLKEMQAKNEKKSAGPPPPRVDFEKLAKENGLSAARTDLMSVWDAQKLDIAGTLPAEIVEGRLRVLSGISVLQSALPIARQTPPRRRDRRHCSLLVLEER